MRENKLRFQVWLTRARQKSNQTDNKMSLTYGFSRRHTEILVFYLFIPNTGFTIEKIIFHFFWDHWARCGIFENRVLLMYTPEGVSSVANFITAYEESQ